MSEENKLAVIPLSDFTMKDLEVIDKFKEKGLLGLHTLKDTDVERCMALYLDGKSYREIARVTQIKKDVILYLAHKFSWWEMRKEYLDELQETLKQKVTESKLQSQAFFLHLVLAYQKKIGKNVDKYLKTDDESWHDKIDGKDLSSLVKIVELLHKLNAETYGTPEGDKSLVAFNGMGEGVTITKTGANSVEITPKATQFQSKLKQFAELKRSQERASQEPPKPVHDIVIEETLTQKEEGNENEIE